MKQYEAYKDSSIQWLGEIPSHWKVGKLKHVATCNDEVLSENTDPELHIDYVEISDVDSIDGIKCKTNYAFKEAPSRARRITRPGDVIISTVRTYLKAITSIKESDLIVSTGFAVIRPKKIDSTFLKYSLLYEGFIDQVIARSVGVSYPAITSTELMGIEIIVPPLAEQEVIAAYLDQKVGQIDAILSEKEAMVEQLQQYRKSLISETVTRGLNPNVPMKDSGIDWIGQIPAHWHLVKLKSIAKVNGRIGYRGYTTEDLVHDGNGAYAIGGKHISKCVLDLSQPDFISWEKYYESPEIMVKKGDLLMAQRGSLGKVALVRDNIEEATINPSLVLINNLKIGDVFLYYYLVSNSCLTYIQLLNTATAVPMISQNQIENLFVLVPPVVEQHAISEFLDKKTKELDTTISELQSQIEDLKVYKSSVITEAVTGKVDLRDWKPSEDNA